MTKSGVIYTNPECLRANKIFIAAKYSGVNLKKDDKFVLGETNKTADYLSNFPCGAVPAYKADDGKCLSESNAIAYYVSNEQLRGKNEYDTAKIWQWIHFADAEITPPLATWALDKIGVKKENAKEIEKAKAALGHKVAVLDDYLKTRTYLVGECVTLADIACYCALFVGYKNVFCDEFHTRFVNVHRWYTTCINQPQAKAVLCGSCEKKEEPKKKAAAAAAAAEEDEEPKKPSSADPFAVLPVGTFKMDEWKRTYSNNDFTTVALPYFWQNFDKENYSMWFAEYKYASDLTHVFMTCNLVAGMYQRLDRMRKHSFGVMAIFGTKNDNTITGTFIWRGHELAFSLSEDLQVDYESYSWRKVDPDSDEAKKLVTDYFGRNSEMEFKGKKFNQAFVWK